METPDIRRARLLAFDLHQTQMHGRLPYCFHIMDVVRNLLDFGYDKEELIIAAYLHDAIEDTSYTLLQMEKDFGPKVSRFVNAVSGFGVNRREKKINMIEKLKDYPKAIPLKMSDRLANMRSSAASNKYMLKMYIGEMKDYHDLFSDTDPAMYSAMVELT